MFLPMAVIICFQEKEEFACRNNDKYGKSANF